MRCIAPPEIKNRLTLQRSESDPTPRTSALWLLKTSAPKMGQNGTKSVVTAESNDGASDTCINRFGTAVPFFRSFRGCKWKEAQPDLAQQTQASLLIVAPS